METWLTQQEACAFLGVRRQTLYAYVSRGLATAAPDPDQPNRSRYRKSDLEALREKRKRGRGRSSIAASTISWGEPIIQTAISTIAQGRLYYRGVDAVAFAEDATLEDAAQLLWASPERPFFPRMAPPPGLRSERARAYASLGLAAEEELPARALPARVRRRDAVTLVGRLASCLCPLMAEGGDDLHLRMAQGWGCADRADLIRRALVLLADQELTTSAFAARVTASTGATLGAAAIAGFAALSGPLHGDATALAQSLIDAVAERGPEAAARRWLDAGSPAPGFGHQLYPEGDPRAADLLARFPVDPNIRALIDYMARATQQKPTIDIALAALARHCGLPRGAAFALFATGRVVGWMAHVMEQIETGALIRPRARYVGPDLTPAGAA